MANGADRRGCRHRRNDQPGGRGTPPIIQLDRPQITISPSVDVKSIVLLFFVGTLVTLLGVGCRSTYLSFKNVISLILGSNIGIIFFIICI